MQPPPAIVQWRDSSWPPDGVGVEQQFLIFAEIYFRNFWAKSIKMKKMKRGSGGEGGYSVCVIGSWAWKSLFVIWMLLIKG